METPLPATSEQTTPGRALPLHEVRSRLTAAAEAGAKNTFVIAALKRCAARNPNARLNILLTAQIPVAPSPQARSGTIAAVPDNKVDHGQTLAKTPLFSGLTESELAFLAQRAVPRHFSAGETVFGEGEPCAGLYVVESGQIRIFKSSAGGREQVLSIDGPGSSVAELPVFDGGNYPASVTAIGDATLLFVSKQDFQALCLAHPQVALKVLRVVGVRLRKLVGIIEELSFTTVRHRLASFLLRLAHAEGRRTPNGVEVALPISNQELASQIGTVRELVSRNFSRFQSEGMLKIDGRSVIIHDLKALEAEVHSAE